jgi:hypothetical protein
MTTGEATHEEAPSGDERLNPVLPRVPPSPRIPTCWLLRPTALAAVAAGAMGVIVAPGVRGNTSEQVVVWMDSASAALAYFLMTLLVALVIWGVLELLHARQVSAVMRSALVGSGAVVVALSGLGLRERLDSHIAVAISAAAAIGAIAAAYQSARAPHTRAVAGALFAFAFAAIARVAAWELATTAGDRASLQLFGYARAFATAGVLFETSGQLVAVTWIGTRSRIAGQLAVSAALVVAFGLTWGVARGVSFGASSWQAVMHTALGDAGGIPPTYGFDAVAVFLVPASLLLALVAAAQPKQQGPVVAAIALALVSRGSFDAPLRALCAVAAAQWATLACADERAMWRALLDDRKRGLERT